MLWKNKQCFYNLKLLRIYLSMFCLSFHAPFIYAVFHLYSSKFPLHLCHFRSYSFSAISIFPHLLQLQGTKKSIQKLINFTHSIWEAQFSHTPVPPIQSQSALRLSFVWSDRSLNLPSVLDESAKCIILTSAKHPFSRAWT